MAESTSIMGEISLLTCNSTSFLKYAQDGGCPKPVIEHKTDYVYFVWPKGGDIRLSVQGKSTYLDQFIHFLLKKNDIESTTFIAHDSMDAVVVVPLAQAKAALRLLSAGSEQEWNRYLPQQSLRITDYKNQALPLEALMIPESNRQTMELSLATVPQRMAEVRACKEEQAAQFASAKEWHAQQKKKNWCDTLQKRQALNDLWPLPPGNKDGAQEISSHALRLRPGGSHGIDFSSN